MIDLWPFVERIASCFPSEIEEEFIEEVIYSDGFYPIELSLIISAKPNGSEELPYTNFLEQGDILRRASAIHPLLSEICPGCRLSIPDITLIIFKIYQAILRGGARGSWGDIEPEGGKKCQYPGCGITERELLQKDHIWPRSLGGPYELWNCQWLCGFHNRMKSNRLVLTKLTDEDFADRLRTYIQPR